jgi:hypothetical protein
MACSLSSAPLVSELKSAVSTIAQEDSAGLIAMPDTFTTQNRGQIIALTAANSLPAVYPFRFMATEGGLLSYGADETDGTVMWRLTSIVFCEARRPASYQCSCQRSYSLWSISRLQRCSEFPCRKAFCSALTSSSNKPKLAAVHESVNGTTRTYRNVGAMSVIEGNPDIQRTATIGRV